MADTDTRLLLRRKDAAHDLGVSQSLLMRWEKEGVIKAVRVPGIRSVRYAAADVKLLAANILDGKLSTAAGTGDFGE